MAKRIYVADDEPHIRTLIQTFLVNEGYEVETFEDGKSLFEAFHTSCPDLIILDIMMPGMDGLCPVYGDPQGEPGSHYHRVSQGRYHGPGHGHHPWQR